MGMMVVDLKQVGTVRRDSDRLKIVVKTPANWCAQDFRTRPGMPSGLASQQDICRTRWKSLRDQFKKEKKKKRVPSTAATIHSALPEAQPVSSIRPPYLQLPTTTPLPEAQPVSSILPPYLQLPTTTPLPEAQPVSSILPPYLQFPTTTPLPEAQSVSPQVQPQPAASTPRPPAKRRRVDTGSGPVSVFERRLLLALEDDTSPPSTPPPPAPIDIDALFFQSLLPSLKKLEDRKKEEVKFKIHQLLFEAGAE
ncbi:uncharacterized protein LOC141761609 [Sebastes fasciatus]|uniref:uncharacterized protein LOC141761609 n=1 Tax=Sebastes fasciatus TaxID=394691 RepID=UPI003D9F02D3